MLTIDSEKFKAHTGPKINYSDSEIDDQDFHIKFLMNSLTPEEFLRIVIRLRPNEALFNIFIKNWNLNLEFINNIQK